jgi:hypothetical protein
VAKRVPVFSFILAAGKFIRYFLKLLKGEGKRTKSAAKNPKDLKPPDCDCLGKFLISKRTLYLSLDN